MKLFLFGLVSMILSLSFTAYASLLALKKGGDFAAIGKITSMKMSGDGKSLELKSQFADIKTRKTAYLTCLITQDLAIRSLGLTAGQLISNLALAGDIFSIVCNEGTLKGDFFQPTIYLNQEPEALYFVYDLDPAKYGRGEIRGTGSVDKRIVK